MRGAEKYVRIIIILESLTKQKIKKVNAIDKIREIFRRYFQLLFYIFREGQGVMFGYYIILIIFINYSKYLGILGKVGEKLLH